MSIKRFIQGNWSQIRTRLSVKYKQLSERDLDYSDGYEDELLRRLQVKLQMGHSELMNELKNIITEAN
jgi:hypothetical protein